MFDALINDVTSFYRQFQQQPLWTQALEVATGPVGMLYGVANTQGAMTQYAQDAEANPIVAAAKGTEEAFSSAGTLILLAGAGYLAYKVMK